MSQDKFLLWKTPGKVISRRKDHSAERWRTEGQSQGTPGWDGPGQARPGPPAPSVSQQLLVVAKPPLSGRGWSLSQQRQEVEEPLQDQESMASEMVRGSAANCRVVRPQAQRSDPCLLASTLKPGSSGGLLSPLPPQPLGPLILGENQGDFVAPALPEG
ncbi:hypothetical protein AAY473_014136 [Plecturocebus cupreus]